MSASHIKSISAARPFPLTGYCSSPWSHSGLVAPTHLGGGALAGGGHIFATTVLGIGLAWFGFELEERFHVLFHWMIATVLVGLGLWLAFRTPHGAA